MAAKKKAPNPAGTGDEGEQENPQQGNGNDTTIVSQPREVARLIDVPGVEPYLRRIGAVARSFHTAVVKGDSNYAPPKAIVRFSDGGVVICPDDLAPDEDEEKAIKAGFAQTKLPNAITIKYGMPEDLADIDPDPFVFRTVEGDIAFVLGRKDEEKEGGAKRKWFYPRTPIDTKPGWSDCEPETGLPLFGLEQLENHSVIFVHEGPKSARAVRRMVEAKTDEDKKKLASHPWGENLKHAAHLAWHGGPSGVDRTDWSPLNKANVSKVYLVADNDTPGRSCVSRIAFRIRAPMFVVLFTSEFPPTFDLGDNFPPEMFSEKGHYQGPAFRELLHPATWLTDVVEPGGKGRPYHVLRPSAKNLFHYIESARSFVCAGLPERVYDSTSLNASMSRFSHVDNVAKLILKSATRTIVNLTYRPDKKGGAVITDNGSSAFNTYRPPDVEAVQGDPGPWLAFLEYLFPIERERHEVARWCATLIAKPGTRMEYAVLLVSAAQGTGKTTLAWTLSRLIGEHNVSWPSERSVVESQFNGWMAHRRLAIVSEIYQGSSWRAYQVLKERVTDQVIEVNEKFEKPYTLQNWCHFLASSNSLQALRLEQEDRRWFLPKIVEEPWPRERFVAFREWLADGGFESVRWWADNFDDYVLAGQRAPDSEAKREVIEASLTFAVRLAHTVAENIKDADEPVAVAWADVEGAIRKEAREKGETVRESGRVLRQVLVKAGLSCTAHGDRIKVDNRIDYMLWNPRWPMPEGVNWKDVLREEWKKPADDFMAV